MMTMTPAEKYADALANPGGWGDGSHCKLLSMANYGIMAGKSAQAVFNDIRHAADQRIPDREVLSAVNRAMSDIGTGGSYHYTGTRTPKPEPVVKDGEATFDRIAAKGIYTTMEEIDLNSPVEIPMEPVGEAVAFISTCYRPDDLILMGGKYADGALGRNIKMASEWVDYLKSGGAIPEFLIANPLTGDWAPTKSGDKQTLRGDNNVKRFQYAVLEFDDKNVMSQCLFYSGVILPIRALTYSGNKSIHALIDLSNENIKTFDQWRAQIKVELFDRKMTPMGVDGACSNPARLTRVPGHLRVEKQKRQRLIWLAQEGRSICPQVD
jgi:hypothetical protein